VNSASGRMVKGFPTFRQAKSLPFSVLISWKTERNGVQCDMCVIDSQILVQRLQETETRSSIVVKALCYKREGCGFDTR
jgi:hypothetical protein